MRINLAEIMRDIPPDIQQHLTRVSKLTGTSPVTLAKIANMESAGDPTAKNRSSSARGLFQITDPSYKLGVAEAKRQGIPMVFNNKNDPGQNATIAGLLLKSQSDAFASKRGRPPTGGELAANHFLGEGDFNKVYDNPNRFAADMAPIAAKANPTLFYRNNTPLTGGEFQSNFNTRYAKAPSSIGKPQPINVPWNFETNNTFGNRSDRNNYNITFNDRSVAAPKPFSSVAKLSAPPPQESYRAPSYESSRIPMSESKFQPAPSEYREGSARQQFNKGNNTYGNTW